MLKLKFLFRSLNNYVFRILEYIETKSVVKTIFDRYDISNDIVQIINYAILVFFYVCIFLIIKAILENFVKFIIKEVNKGSEEYIIGDEPKNEEMSYQNTQELDSEYIRKMVEESQKNKKNF